MKYKNIRRMYHDLAKLWPIISPPNDYVGEAELFTRLIRANSGIPARTLLHIGCGGGHNDMTLKKRFDMNGIDISRAMLALARRLNPEVEYHCGDMRTVRLGRLFDAVVIADSITYMTTEEDLSRAFTTAYVHLKPGGVFCTYAELSLERFRQNATEVTTHKHRNLEVVFLENTYDPDSSDTTCEFKFVFLIKNRGRLRVETDCHVAGLFKLQSWLDALYNAGFKVKESEYPGEGIPMFVCIKPLTR